MSNRFATEYDAVIDSVLEMCARDVMMKADSGRVIVPSVVLDCVPVAGA